MTSTPASNSRADHEPAPPSSPRLAGRRALVTGAGSGIGAATARQLVTDGAQTTGIGRRGGPLESLATQHAIRAVTADVTDSARLAEVFADTEAAYGGIDLVVANAGVMLGAPYEEQSEDDWTRMVEVNLLGLQRTAQLAIPRLLSAAEKQLRADLVLVSSIGAHVVMPHYAAYFASKAAVTQLTRVLRQEFGPRGVRIRAIEPGMTATELATHVTHPQTSADLHEFASQVPPVPAERVAELIAWSCSLPRDVNVAEAVVLPTVQG